MFKSLAGIAIAALAAVLGSPPAPASAETLSISSAIPAPAGFQRKDYPEGSYSRFVQSLPVKKDRRIAAFDGSSIPENQFNVFAVIALPLLFKQDLEQCADFAMRLWAEYHRQGNTLDRFYLFDYGGKRRGFAASGKGYPSFLKWSFANSNSFSLKRGCAPVKEAELAPGDMLIQNENGGIGHVSVIVDICEGKAGEKLYLFGFSYMPAQEFHIEKSIDEYGRQGWFTLAGYKEYLAATLPYGPPVPRRFAP